jgi:hypothetical protein
MKTNKRAAKYNCKAEKKCPVCQRVFTWRKKWQRDWDKVIYCSKRCQNEKRKHD